MVEQSVEEVKGRLDFHDQVINDYRSSFDELYDRMGKLEESVNNLNGLVDRVGTLESASGSQSQSQSASSDLESRLAGVEAQLAELKSTVTERLNALSAMYSNLRSSGA